METAMPDVKISQDAYEKLKLLAEPLVDTAQSVVERLIDEAVSQLDAAPTPNGQAATRPTAQLRRFDPDRHPSLKHAKLLAASIDGKPLSRPKWNDVFRQIHILAKQRLGSVSEVKRVSTANIRQGQYEDDGFTYLPGADLSIQGVDSNFAWDHSLRVARALEVPIEVTFEWRNKEDAAYPGTTAVLEWSPRIE